MTDETLATEQARAAAAEGAYFALFRVAAIAELEGPTKAVEWAQSLLDDEQLRAGFATRTARELRTRRLEAKPAVGPQLRTPDSQLGLDAEIPLLAFRSADD